MGGRRASAGDACAALLRKQRKGQEKELCLGNDVHEHVLAAFENLSGTNSGTAECQRAVRMIWRLSLQTVG